MPNSKAGAQHLKHNRKTDNLCTIYIVAMDAIMGVYLMFGVAILCQNIDNCHHSVSPICTAIYPQRE